MAMRKEAFEGAVQGCEGEEMLTEEFGASFRSRLDFLFLFFVYGQVGAFFLWGK